MQVNLKIPLPPKSKSNYKGASKTKYLKVQWTGHPLAHADGQVYEHRAVLYEKIGPGVHECHWCGKKVAWFTSLLPEARRLVADHLDGDEWRNTPSNLVPSCHTCNFQRGMRPNFLTHCTAGHEFTAANTYLRPDGKGRQCRTSSTEREARRPPRKV